LRLEKLRDLQTHGSDFNQHENTREINELIIHKNKLSNEERQFWIDESVANLRVLQATGELKDIDLAFSRHDFGTISNLNAFRDTIPSEGRVSQKEGGGDVGRKAQESRERASKSYQKRKYGIGETKLFPTGYKDFRKLTDPLTGKETFTEALPENKRFKGWDTKHNPIFEETKARESPKSSEKFLQELMAVENEINAPSYESSQPTNSRHLRGQQLRIIRGLAK